ncbi:MAG TPA: iron-sulfur cluster assembly scaffold protein [Syntrophales bacterium]|nr:iron-sulfur cluster assembly scaffold protein [Syntrophales bacterium]HOX93787.1 iron-sulfur cluster assembly scaffold protein [Syntrophales bacterium]HPI56141.1 iron-sulfur cluster assembly scaffold protein [Syntrophales bacterium]HPN23969.1 iron-sulfur cluster assembly scaffold protein [Syntrophales bacterium]HQM28248.1 iron-sulfur cluster assembly scaffold protein [Syntrophales bacterium]
MRLLDDEIRSIKEILDLLNAKTDRGFSEKVIDYGLNPRNCGVMENPDAHARVTGPCGDTVEIYLRFQNGKINDIRYTTDGCMTSHAAVSAATVLAKGKTVRECIRINQSAIMEHLGGLPEEDQHCALLAATTLHRALRNYAAGKKRLKP